MNKLVIQTFSALSLDLNDTTALLSSSSKSIFSTLQNFCEKNLKDLVCVQINIKHCYHYQYFFYFYHVYGTQSWKTFYFNDM